MLIMILSFSSAEERDKFDYIYNNYKNLLMHKAYGILHDTMLAEDAVSEALLRVYKNLHKIEDPSSGQSAAFVVTIVKNTALTILSREKKYAADEIEDTTRDSFDLEQSVLSDLGSQDIYYLLDRINEDLRSVFLLKYAYDMSHKEIGRALGITENNVTVRLHRAKKKLASLLRKEGVVHE